MTWKGGDILFLDLASQMGWCEGEPGGTPRFGTERLAPEGSSHAATFAGMTKWLGRRLQAFKPRLIVYEAPIPPIHMKGRTNLSTTRVAFGLAAITESVAYLSGVYDIREAQIGDVRRFFLKRNPKSATAKTETIAQCRLLGFEPQDDNAADALAGWFFACSIVSPKTTFNSTPLFGRKGAR